MRLYIRYIVAFITLALATGCSMDDVDYGTPSSKGDVVTVIGRITPFTDYDVDTRGAKQGNEGKLTSMAMAIFPVNDAGTGLADDHPVFYQYSDQGQLLFNIDRSESDGEGEELYTKNKKYAIYVFANMPGLGSLSKGCTLDQILATAYTVSGIDIPANGFPMIGSLGDTFSTNFDKDGQVFILAPTEDGSDDYTKLIAPTVDGATKTLLTIPMKALFAKINFTIEVRPDQTIEGNYTPQFTLENYKIYNIPETVDFDNTTNNDTAVVPASEEGIAGALPANTVASGANKINFTFYLPERKLEPAIDAYANAVNHFDYDANYSTEDVDKNDNGWRDEDEKHFQRFKPELVEGSVKKATNIVIHGRYRDHQNHMYDVDYTIYLGADNFKDFNILRNCEYNNFVTIKGIQTTNDMSDSKTAIDHRVNVERTQPAIISLRRETELDSHFEIRPIRVKAFDVGTENLKLNPNDLDDERLINAVKIKVENPTTTNWVRLERSFGGRNPEVDKLPEISSGVSIYIDSDPNDPAYGKRKYFTYYLINGDTPNATDESLVGSTEVVLPLLFDGEGNPIKECCWMYVDENTNEGDGSRTGVISVTYGNLTGSEFIPTTNETYPKVDYIISQRNLFSVTYGGKSYNIEYHEEYLHSFDAEDPFSHTNYEGMQWGLTNNELELSDEIPAILVSKGSWGDVDDDIYEALLKYSPKYDFYLPRDVDKNRWNFNQYSYDNMVHPYAGYDFSKKIIDKADIGVLALNENPQSAVEYCYNKNKRDKNGNVKDIVWYLPAIDEIEEIVMSTYNDGGNTYNTYVRFKDFQEKFYWSSQPAYLNNYAFVDRDFYGAGDRYAYYMIDDKERARATSVKYEDGVYDKVSSESTGFYKYIDADYEYTKVWGAPVPGTGKLKEDTVTENLVESEITITGSNQSDSWTHTLTKSSPAPGNKPRNSLARVRCVRKK